MTYGFLFLSLLASVASAGAAAAVTAERTVSGLWDASVTTGGLVVPFRFGISSRGNQASGWFFNGNERIRSTSGRLESNHLILDFATYAKRLDVTLGDDGTLSGTYAPSTPGSTGTTYSFEAHRVSTAAHTPSDKVPHISGLWLVPTESHKANEQAWRLIVRQSGAEVSAALLRVDGDTGALTGRWQDGKLLLSHFDGARPARIEVTAGSNGTLQLLMRGARGTDQTLTAYRAADAQARGLPQAADPTRHTVIQDPAAPFEFSFPDLQGKVVSRTDARFAGKVLLVDVSGSWCPNCHDEAPFLQALYRKYHARGLEIVTLSFEEPEQLANPQRLRAFIREYGIEYPVLLAGTPQELQSKLPHATGLDAFPTTFFLGRDGRVRGVHAGFAAAATGEFNVRLKKDFAARIEQLLAEKAHAAPRTAQARG